METTTPVGRLLLDAYVDSLLGQGFRSATIDSRRRCLQSIDRAIGLDHLDPKALEALADIRSWSKGTRYAYASVCALFTAWEKREGLIDKDPWDGIRKPRQPRYRPRPITHEQLETLLARLGEPYRSWAVLAAYAGLRRDEITKVRREDLVETLDGFDLVVPDGKGGKADAVPAHPEVVSVLRGGGVHGYVFLTRTGNPFTPGHLGELAAHAFRGVGVPCGLHQLRHLFGTQLYADTHDIYAVQRALRHDSIRSTETYVKADVSWIRDAVCAL
jgi:integrase